LSFFITAYRTLAEWQSVVARLDGFEGSIRGGDAFAQRQDIIRVKPAGRDGIELDDLVVTLPDGKPLLAADGFKLPN
ncbi:hypothetical protein ABTE23_22205, partial [Acinetobacter baumannii]